MTKTRRAAWRQSASSAPMSDFAGDALMQLIDEALQDDEDAVTQFTDYLDGCGNDEDTGAEWEARIIQLIGTLDQLRIDCSDGDHEARENMRAIHDLLNSALDCGSLDPAGLIITGKIFHDAGWTVPDALKQAVMQAIPLSANDDSADVAGDVSSLLTGFVGAMGTDPFEIHESLNSLLAAFPAEACGRLLAGFDSLRSPELNLALAGFMLHPDSVIAKAAADASLAAAGSAPVDSLLIENLAHMRPWLPQARQLQLDSVIKALRPHALPPHERALPALAGCYASVCDGSGTRSVSISQRAGARYRFASVLIKPSGISQVAVVPDLSKSALGQVIRQMEFAAPMSKTNAVGIARMLRLALADNASCANLPPFRLVEIAGSLGLAPLDADYASAAEIAEELLAGLPEDETNAAAAMRAHSALPGEELVEQWFEAGEAVEDLLRPLKNREQRVTALMATYLPSRRQFWSRQCAISALALRPDGVRSCWKQLALAARDMASDLPLDRIPLMQHIAEASVRAFESQR